jgi:hypothetical protein
VSIAGLSEKDEFHALNFSEFSSVLKLPSNLKFFKIYLQKTLYEEYKLIAPEILYELGQILQKYAEHNIIFPEGIINLMNYSWQDLIEDTYNHASKATKFEQDKSSQRDSTSKTIINLKKFKISSHPRGSRKENRPVKAKKEHHVVSSRSTEKMCK